MKGVNLLAASALISIDFESFTNAFIPSFSLRRQHKKLSIDTSVKVGVDESKNEVEGNRQAATSGGLKPLFGGDEKSGPSNFFPSPNEYSTKKTSESYHLSEEKGADGEEQPVVGGGVELQDFHFVNIATDHKATTRIDGETQLPPFVGGFSPSPSLLVSEKVAMAIEAEELAREIAKIGFSVLAPATNNKKKLKRDDVSTFSSSNSLQDKVNKKASISTARSLMDATVNTEGWNARAKDRASDIHKLLSDDEMERLLPNQDMRYPRKLIGKPLSKPLIDASLNSKKKRGIEATKKRSLMDAPVNTSHRPSGSSSAKQSNSLLSDSEEARVKDDDSVWTPKAKPLIGGSNRKSIVDSGKMTTTQPRTGTKSRPIVSAYQSNTELDAITGEDKEKKSDKEKTKIVNTYDIFGQAGAASKPVLSRPGVSVPPTGSPPSFPSPLIEHEDSKKNSSQDTVQGGYPDGSSLKESDSNSSEAITPVKGLTTSPPYAQDKTPSSFSTKERTPEFGMAPPKIPQIDNQPLRKMIDDSKQKTFGKLLDGEDTKDALERLKREAQAKSMQDSHSTPSARYPSIGAPDVSEAGPKTKSPDHSTDTSTEYPSTTDESGNIKPVLKLAAAKGVQVMLNWSLNKDTSLVGFVYNSPDFPNGQRIVTTRCISQVKPGYLVETETGSQYLLE